MQDRAPVTVGSARCLNKIKQSITAYQKVVNLFPLPPVAGEMVSLPAEPQPQPGPAPTPKAEKPMPKMEEPKSSGRSKGMENLISGKNKKPVDESELDRMLRAGMSHSDHQEITRREQSEDSSICQGTLRTEEEITLTLFSPRTK